MNNKDYTEVFDQVDQLFKQVDKTFKTMEEHMDQIYVKYSTQAVAKWETHKLKWPKRIKGKWYWPGNKVWRKFHLSPGGGYWEYGNDFDVLKDSGK